MKAKKPIMSADPSSAQEFRVLAALGFDYYKHGRATGRLVHRILTGEDPASIPVQFMSDPNDVDQLLINLDVAREIGVDVPEEIVERANILRENGEIELRESSG
jgi:putative ABC transport system substrate-binding protein